MNIKEFELKEFLKTKPISYDKIDFVPVKSAWEILKSHVKLPFVVHVVGTNGKGTTGRFLSTYLHKLGFKTLHYSSPHIQNFNERIWINGQDVNDDTLEEAHKKVLEILSKELANKLTYFEYTTLLGLYLSSGADYLILEAGLGGEFDATNTVKNDLSLIAPISFDHQEFLGNSIEEIAKTKLKACDNFMILAKQTHEEVYEITKDYKHKKAKEFDTDFLNLPKYLQENLNLALSALEYLKLPINLEDFSNTVLQGRYQKIKPNITIDVGHNPLAANAILEEFQKNNKKISLVYNSLKNKDYKTILCILKPILNEVLIIEINDEKIVLKENLVKTCKELQIQVNDFIKIEKEKDYLVFGSFLVVEEFLKRVKNEK